MSQPYNIPRLLIAGAASNVGKTTVTAGLIAALREQGVVVQPFKCGPDYIDPTWHSRAAGRACRNLDTWMLDDAMLVESFVRACRGADVAVIEGMMGLFDGADWDDERGSTAQISKLLGTPIVLVADICAAANSAAVPVLGCRQFDPEAPLAAVVLNRAGSEGHAGGCARAITGRSALPVLGWLPAEDRLRVPQRHLGLMPGGEHPETEALIGRIAAQVSARFDLQALLGIARAAQPVMAGKALWSLPPVGGQERLPTQTDRGRERKLSAVRPPVLAVARDEAFCFYYPENLELLQAYGAVIEFFSPIRGECPPEGADGVYLGGGYPELHAAALADNTALWQSLRALRARDAPLYAECGGFMALTEDLLDLEGRRWPMAGLVPGTVRMSDQLAALGYRYATAPAANLLVDAGGTLRGHEFRYSSWEADLREAELAAAWKARSLGGPEGPIGYAQGNLLASYLHVHFGQSPAIASRFVGQLARTRAARQS
ncbi:MAG TPA: cobyrinate a,c-diamide synthase [Steroidobacteraceae bacterium]